MDYFVIIALKYGLIFIHFEFRVVLVLHCVGFGLGFGFIKNGNVELGSGATKLVQDSNVEK